MTIQQAVNEFNRLHTIFLTTPTDAGLALVLAQQEKINQLLAQPALQGERVKVQGEIEAKVASVFSQATSSSSSSSIAQPIAGVKGFRNSANNCWANAFLQMVLNTPSLEEMYRVVANANPNVQAKMLRALEQYRNTSSEPADAAVSQGVREAFHELFNRFSPSASRQEDADEARSSLVEAYSLLMPDSPHFTPLETITECQLVNLLPCDPNNVRDRTQLNQDNTIRSTERTNLIPLHIAPGVPFEYLLEGFFHTDLNQDDLATYWTPDGNLGSYKRLSETHCFTKEPEEFFLRLNRFQMDGSKIGDRVDVPRYLTLPAHTGRYALDSFIQHLGATSRSGHYIAYKRVDGRWYCCNDATVRAVSEADVDQALRTSYIYHYSKTTEAVSTSPRQISPIERLEGLLREPKRLAEQLRELEAAYPQIVWAFHHILWIHYGKDGRAALDENPSRLLEIKDPYIMPTGGNLIEQAIAFEERKQLEEFITRADTSFVGELPEKIRWKLEGKIYTVHKKELGVPELPMNYGKDTLEHCDVRELIRISKLVLEDLKPHQAITASTTLTPEQKKEALKRIA
ncbi:MAG: hypothetical protein JSS61_05830 [Verrucomicrobia bacterium]|nr:hypothetical protein [Verrucomicrobiota bacterium]